MSRERASHPGAMKLLVHADTCTELQCLEHWNCAGSAMNVRAVSLKTQLDETYI